MASKKEGFGRGGSAHRLNKADRDRILKKKKGSRANPSQVKTSIKSSKKSRPEATAKAAAVPKTETKPSTELGKPDKAAEKANKGTDRINVDTDYRTVVDEIYEFVEGQGEITLTELSKKMNVPADRLEEWAKVFDRQGLLELDYPMMGDIIIRKKGYAAEQKKAKHPDKKAKAAEGQAVKDAKPNQDAAKQPGDIKADAAKLAASKLDAAKTVNLKADAAKTQTAANQAGAAAQKPELTDEEKKQKRKKTMKLAMFGIGAVIVALIGVLVYFLIKGGYIKFV